MNSRYPRRIVITAFALLPVFLAACAGRPIPAPVSERAASGVKSQRPPAATYTVKRGDTLYSIAFQYGYSYQEVAGWNALAPPYTIYIGQRLTLHAAAVPARPSANDAGSVVITPVPPPAAIETQPLAVPATPVFAKPAQPAVPATPAVRGAGSTWTWPAQGPVLRAYKPGGSKGIHIGGEVGDSVYAAANGRVVYSGSGLVGYGPLIIIKHDDHLLSAYGYNSKLLVKEGEQVAVGQQIAAMGWHTATRAALHFEIRRDGKPVDPLPFLPR